MFLQVRNSFIEYTTTEWVELRNNNIQYESKRIIPINYKGIIGYGESDIIVYLGLKQ